MKLFNRLLKNNKFFVNAEHEENVEEVRKNIIKDKFERYHKSSTGETPEYSFYNGEYSTPSKLWFYQNPLFKEGSYDVNLTTFMQELHQNLSNKMISAFGSMVPNSRSAHTNLHSTVAQVLSTKYPNTNNYEDNGVIEAMVIDCIGRVRETHGNKGNIYNKANLEGFIYAIVDFCNLRRSTETLPQITDTDMYLETKLRKELEKNGIVIEGNTVKFDSSKLSPPKNLKDKYPDLDAHTILMRANALYNTTHSNVPTVAQGVISINYPDIVEINAPDIDLEKWQQEQLEVINQTSLEDAVDFSSIKYYAGSDISFDKDDANKAVACFVIFDRKTDEKVGEVTVRCKTNIPYKAGYLAFREAPILLKLLDITREECPEIMPELIMFDGNGVWHPRKCGIATHFSVLSGVPCFGVAKGVLVLDGVTREGVYEQIEKEAPDAGSMTSIYSNGEKVGAAFNTTGTVKSSIFISPGNGISFDTCEDFTKRVTKHTVTEPIRQADLLSRHLLTTF